MRDASVWVTWHNSSRRGLGRLLYLARGSTYRRTAHMPNNIVGGSLPWQCLPQGVRVPPAHPLLSTDGGQHGRHGAPKATAGGCSSPGPEELLSTCCDVPVDWGVRISPGSSTERAWVLPLPLVGSGSPPVLLLLLRAQASTIERHGIEAGARRSRVSPTWPHAPGERSRGRSDL